MYDETSVYVRSTDRSSTLCICSTLICVFRRICEAGVPSLRHPDEATYVMKPRRLSESEWQADDKRQIIVYKRRGGQRWIDREVVLDVHA
jgi:hypothetical protein